MPPPVGSVLAIDIGGTKLAVAVVAPDGARVAQRRCPALSQEGPEAMLERIFGLCAGVLDDSNATPDELRACGVGCGGPLDRERGIILGPPNLPGWDRVPLAERVSARLGLPVFVDNDANAAALGELRFGAGVGHRNLVYLTVSTGVGGGVILDGRLCLGESGNAAELGHLTVDHRGRACGCGGRGCLEAYASGTSIAKRTREALASGAPSSLRELSAVSELTAEHVSLAAKAGDPLAARIWEETLDALAAGVTNAIHAFNPARVVLGGGVTRAGEQLFEPLRRRVRERAMPALVKDVEIVPSALGDDVGLVGAAAVAFTRLGELVPERYSGG